MRENRRNVKLDDADTLTVHIGAWDSRWLDQFIFLCLLLFLSGLSWLKAYACKHLLWTFLESALKPRCLPLSAPFHLFPVLSWRPWKIFPSSVPFYERIFRNRGGGEADFCLWWAYPQIYVLINWYWSLQPPWTTSNILVSLSYLTKRMQRSYTCVFNALPIRHRTGFSIDAAKIVNLALHAKSEH